MKLRGEITLTEVYSGVLLDTEDGEKLGICMRDGAFEINVIGPGPAAGWYVVGSNGVHRMESAPKVASETNHDH